MLFCLHVFTWTFRSFRVRVQICNLICLILLERAMFGNYHAQSSLYNFGKTTIWQVVKAWWIWMRKVFFLVKNMRMFSLNMWNMVWTLQDRHGGTTLRWQMTDFIYIHEQFIKLFKKIFHIHNHQAFTTYPIAVFAKLYSEECGWSLPNMALSESIRKNMLHICTRTRNKRNVQVKTCQQKSR